MRIISDFHDYYDVVQRDGQDPSVVWIRKRIKITPNINPFPTSRKYSQYFLKYGGPHRIDQYIIGFCGKIYPLIKLSLLRVYPEVTSFCYNIQEVDGFVDEHCKNSERDAYYRTRGIGKWWRRKSKGSRNFYEAFFETCEKKQDDFENLFINNRSPVFVGQQRYRHYEITFNDCLKPFEFYRVFDVYTAFQEISMYYGGVIGGVRECVPDVDDKTLAEAKGFDKWSFRKLPTKPK
jgi:hypothetical protein